MKMSQGARSRDRRSVPVEGDYASGAADPFDGNYTNRVQAWMFPLDWDESDMELMMAQLIDFTAMGHLAWVLFPPEGFRID